MYESIAEWTKKFDDQRIKNLQEGNQDLMKLGNNCAMELQERNQDLMKFHQNDYMYESIAEWAKKIDDQRVKNLEEGNQDLMKLGNSWAMELQEADDKLSEAVKIIRNNVCYNSDKVSLSIKNLNDCNIPFNSVKTEYESKLNSESHEYDYDVAFSYASEQENYVEPLAIKLKNKGIKVFCAKFEESKLWGKDLYEYFADIYMKKSKYCVIFISADYARKLWTTHERKNAQARAFKEREEYIWPVRFDDTEVPGIRETIFYIDARKTTSEKLAKIIIEKLSNN